MQQITLDNSLATKLTGLTELSQLRDENGRLLGHYVPAGTVRTAANATCPFDDEEIEQLRQQTGGRPLAEIWRDLGRN